MIGTLYAGECFRFEVNGLHFGSHVKAFWGLDPNMIADFDARRIAALGITDRHILIAAFDKTDDHFSFWSVLKFFTEVRLKILQVFKWL